MVRAFFFSLLFAMSASIAWAADQPVYAPPGAWVKSIPIPTAAAPSDGSAIQVLLVDEQSRFGADGDEHFIEFANKILTPQGLGPAGAISEAWDPATETLVIHRLQIIRDGKIIDVLAGGQKFLVLRRENNLELAMLDGRLTATIEPEGLQIGDVVDFAFTLQRHDPVLAGHSSGYDRLVHPGVASRVYFGAEWADSKPIRWRATDGMQAPEVMKSGSDARLSADMKDIETPKPPVGAPARFQEMGSLEFSDFASWNDVSKLFAQLYQKASTLKPDSQLQAEISKIAASSTDPKVRATAALRLVEDQTRYVFLGMNDAGYVPADADVTWSRRFGDCKGKAALLLAVLRGLGLQAEPALVSSAAGDGMDQRLPTATRFDHVIVRVPIQGKTYWLDGTRSGDRDIDDLLVPPFHWALPLTPEGSTLVALTQTVPSLPQSEQAVSIDASKGGDAPAPTHVETLYRGDYAVLQRQLLQAVPESDRDRILKQVWTRTFPWLDVAKVTETDDPADHAVELTADGSAKLDWTTDPRGTRFYRVPNTVMGAATSFKRQPGPHQDAPYAVAFPLYAKTSYRITLPSGGQFVLVGSDIDETVGGYARQRKARIENQVLTVEMTTRSTAPELPYVQAQTDEAALTALGNNGVAVIDQTGREHRGPSVGAISSPDETAAASGDAAAQYRLGQAYATGQGAPFDPDKAMTWLKKSADQGYASAQTAIGDIYNSNGFEGPPDHAQAATWYRKAADRDDPAAEYQLALIYRAGRGVPANPDEADQWLHKAASRGYAPAEGEIGYEYEAGVGRPKDPVQALPWVKKAAEQGNAASENTLGMMYDRGEGTPVDLAAAAQWFRKSAEQSHARAQYNLGLAYLKGRGVSLDYAQAMIWFQRAAAQGFGGGDYGLGLLYENGLGVTKDQAQGLEWFRKGAEQNDAPSAAALGSIYLKGEGVPKDPEESFRWYEKSAALGLPQGQYGLGLAYVSGFGVRQNLKMGVDWLTKAADQDYAPAMDSLADFYLTGPLVVRNPDMAKVWFEKAAALGDAGASKRLAALGSPRPTTTPSDSLAALTEAAGQGSTKAEIELANRYALGRGVPEDLVQSAQWMRKASDAGDIKAEIALAMDYRLGRGVTQDPQASATWMRKAADRGDSIAQGELARDYITGFGVTQDYAQALDLARKSADQGDPRGEAWLGYILMSGLGVQKDYDQARVMLQRAAEQNDSAAMVNLGFLYDHGFGIPQDFAQAMLYYRKAADLGHPGGELNVGIMYWQARGVPRDAAEAVKWFRKSAEQGNAQAERFLAVAYMRGDGAPADNAQAADWLDKAIKGGDPRAPLLKQRLEASNSTPSLFDQADTNPSQRPAP